MRALARRAAAPVNAKPGRGRHDWAKLTLTESEIRRIAEFTEDTPLDTLGPHLYTEDRAVIVRAFLPRAQSAWLTVTGRNGRKIAMECLDPRGLFHAVVETESLFPYTIGFVDAAGYAEEFEDPYAFPLVANEEDAYLWAEGTHLRSYEIFGAHARTVNGVPGVNFALWAPNARAVSVLGNFNHWIPGAHPMSRVRFSGLWSLFVPGLKAGELYKYAIQTGSGVREKIDPFGFETEIRPRTASIVTDFGRFRWSDADWLAARAKANPYASPISIYEVHLGSWRRKYENGEWRFLGYRELARELVRYVKDMGFTHIELMPVMEHPLDESWGYQTVNYFAPTRRFGAPEDFMFLVDHCHRSGIGVILDWVPSHFPKDAHGLADFDGRPIYAYENWKKGEHREWGTLVFDYGRREVRNFLMSNALFWLDRYHADGLRVDAVASMLYLDYSRREGEWEPNAFGGREHLEAADFLRRLNEILPQHHPGVLTIAEESTAWPRVSRPTYLDGLGFCMKWNMGWMHDTLEYFSKEPVHRKYHQNMLTFSLLYAFTENFVLPISHDEVVYGKRALLEKMPGDDWQKFANLRLFLGTMFAHPGKKLLFMGSEFGQRSEWNSLASLDWHLLDYEPHRQIRDWVRELNHTLRANRALYESDFEGRGFEWIDFHDAESSVVSFLRWSWDRRDCVAAICNFTPVPRMGYRIGVPRPGFYKEILNSDSVRFGGSGIGNAPGVRAEPVPWHARPYSIAVNFPPLAMALFAPETA